MLDLRDVMLEVTAEMQTIALEFAAEIAQPMMKQKFLEMWATLPDEMKQQFAEEKPAEYQRLMDEIKE